MTVEEQRAAIEAAFGEAIRALDLATDAGRQEFGRLMRERDADLAALRPETP